MARTTPAAAVAGNELVLGLLIERPGTIYELEQRLKDRFASSQFGRGTARQAVKRLAGDGLVREADESSRATQAAGVRPRKSRCVPTAAGVEHFRGWMRGVVAVPPVREELHAKIALCQPEDLPEMIAAVREAEQGCLSKLHGEQWRKQREQRALSAHDWQRRMALLVSSGDVAWWGARIEWLQSVRGALEKEKERYEAEHGPLW